MAEMVKAQHHQAESHISEQLHPYSRSVSQFCHFIEYYSQYAKDPRTVAMLCEEQAEAVRISKQDVSVETIDLLLNTMLNTLYNMSEVQEKKRWGTRLKGAFLGHKQQPAFSQGSVAFQG
ncbi:hypothetical protein CSA56_04680 [candidate division KSB3 bacterium]|uniref:Uncharacterized protein n=1 Tax=candidate division KSB3 bacterium TaxID=2044937 RepID=A0A2G6KI48_9BACT|nr:MAG: hypothetical protein CSA56_04680 [candidate division KSB3 bacterium]